MGRGSGMGGEGGRLSGSGSLAEQVAFPLVQGVPR
jgi:hypothetical protein